MRRIVAEISGLATREIMDRESLIRVINRFNPVDIICIYADCEEQCYFSSSSITGEFYALLEANPAAASITLITGESQLEVTFTSRKVSPDLEAFANAYGLFALGA